MKNKLKREKDIYISAFNFILICNGVALMLLVVSTFNSEGMSLWTIVLIAVSGALLAMSIYLLNCNNKRIIIGNKKKK